MSVDTTRAPLTSAYLNLLAQALLPGSSALQNATDAAITWVAIGTGVTQLAGAGALVAGTPYTSLPCTALPFGMPSGQSLTIIYETNADTLQLSAPANPGDPVLAIASWTPSYAYPVGAGLLRTPAAADVALDAEVARVPLATAVAGVNAGESLVGGYFSPTTLPSGTYLEGSFFAGATASATAGSGVLVARTPLWWPHVSGSDANMLQLDLTV